MDKIRYQIKQKDGDLVYPPPQTPLSSFSAPYDGINYEKHSTPTSTFSRISPFLLLLIVILTVIFFICGLLHLLFRIFMKRPYSSAIYQSNRYPETSGSNGLQRQLQQLFHLHDSGLDQASIDALPVFHYKDIMGLKEPFDCAVCLCEFSDQDKLRLLPKCSHAFHIDCIDTWLLSNSTCPLCRGALMGSGHPMEVQVPVFNFDVSREVSNRFLGDGENGFSSSQKTINMEEGVGEKRVFSVRLGQFKSLNGGVECGETRQGETSSCHLDSRRCYSMGTFQYVVDDSNLQVALSDDDSGGGGSEGSNNVKLFKERGHLLNSVIGDAEGKKISGRTRGESFSVSKIWLWSKKSRFPSSSNTHIDLSPPSRTVSMPMNDRTETV